LRRRRFAIAREWPEENGEIAFVPFTYEIAM
jgi:hypothetical protein